MILFTPVPAVATPETALAAIVTAIVTATGPSDASRATAGAGRASATAIATATGPSDASRATAATVHARVTAERPRRPTPATARLPAATRGRRDCPAR